MPRIVTQKHPIIVGATATAALSVRPNEVIDAVDNDGVVHMMVLTPEEAMQKGVALIQLAAQARAIADQQKLIAARGDAGHGSTILQPTQ